MEQQVLSGMTLPELQQVAAELNLPRGYIRNKSSVLTR